MKTIKNLTTKNLLELAAEAAEVLIWCDLALDNITLSREEAVRILSNLSEYRLTQIEARQQCDMLFIGNKKD